MGDLRKALARAGNSQLSTQDLREMIAYYGGLTEEIESRRNDLHRGNIQALGIILTGVALLLSLRANLPPLVLWSLFSALAVQGVFVFASEVAHVLQSRFRYPFLSESRFGNQWKWFYHGNPHLKSMSSRVVFRGSELDARDREKYRAGLEYFLEAYAEETVRTEREDSLV